MYDVGTGLNYAGDRYYDSTIGKFLSQDPVSNFTPERLLADPQQLNEYSYGRDNPLRYNDPQGQSIWDTVAGFANAWISNNALGAGRIAPSNYGGSSRGDYSLGQTLGDAASMVSGMAEVAAGGSMAGAGMTGGLALCPVTGGTSAVAGGAAATEGIAIAGHGAATAELGAYNFSKDARNGSSRDMPGQNGTRTSSTTVGRGDGWRVDVENPAPGERPGQIHYQSGDSKFMYDHTTNSFRNMDGTALSNSQNKQLINNPNVMSAVNKGMKYLGVGK